MLETFVVKSAIASEQGVNRKIIEDTLASLKFAPVIERSRSC
jgi:hypothetical protein